MKFYRFRAQFKGEPKFSKILKGVSQKGGGGGLTDLEFLADTLEDTDACVVTKKGKKV